MISRRGGLLPRIAAFVLTAVAVAGLIWAQSAGTSRTRNAYLPTSEQASEQLQVAQRLIEQGRWGDAVAALEDVIDRYPDRVVALQDGLYISVRDYAHLLVARSGPDGLAAYRLRVDARAEAMYRRAIDRNDVALLRALVDRYFCSSRGDDALDLLAEHAFEAGRFDEAVALWRRLLPEAGDGDTAHVVLCYPDTDLNRAELAAKQVIALAFGGHLEEAYARYRQFRERYPEAVGRLAGQEDLWVQHLGKLLKQLGRATKPSSSDWPTFARTPARTGVAPEAVDIGSVQWSVTLPPVVQAPRGFISRQMATPPASGRAAYHPIVAKGYVIVCNQSQVLAYRLQEGPGEAERPAWTYELRTAGAAGFGRMPYGVTAPPQFTLTASGDRLYVRLGTPMAAPLRKAGRTLESYVVCLSLSADGKLLWQRRIDEPDTVFEGAPVVAGDRVFIAARTGGSMLRSTVYCFDARTGRKLWSRLVCESPQSGRYYDRLDTAQSLITVGQGLAFYATNLGAVAALDTETGEIRWIWTYPRKQGGYYARQARRPTVRAAIYDRGRLFVAPADADRVSCLDASSGRVLWEVTAGTLDATGSFQMLGIHDDCLIISGEQVMALEATTGRKLWQFPPAGGRLAARGRGVLAGDLLYVPDETQIYVLDVKTGRPDRPAVELVNQHHQQPGNLIVADGYLIVAGEKLAVLCEYGLLIRRYREQLARRPTSATLHLKLARALEATGQAEAAAKAYRAALEHARPGERVDGVELAAVCRERLYHLLLRQAKQLVEQDGQQQTARAVELLKEAVAVAPTAGAELEGRLTLAAVWQKAGKPQEALAAYQEILAQQRLRSLPYAVSTNRSVRADVVVYDRIEQLLREHGRELYAVYEEQVRRGHQQALEERNPLLLRKLLARYPNSTLRYRLWLDLGRLLAEQQRWSEAADAYRMASSIGRKPQERAAALIGLAQALEAQRLWPAAARVLIEARQLAPEAKLPEGGVTLAAYVDRKLQEDAFRWTLRREQGLMLPLGVKWQQDWGQGAKVLLAEGTPPVGMKPVFFVQRTRSLACVDALTASEMWRLPTTTAVRWAGFVADKLVVTDDRRVVAVTVADGTVAWSHEFAAERSVAGPLPRGYELDEAPGNRRLQARLSPRPGRAQWAAGEPPSLRVCGFADDRLYVLSPGGELVALSAAKGTQLWAFRPTTGRLGEHVAVSPRLVVVQNVAANRILVLDSDGRVRWELDGAGGQWARDPVWVDSRRVCAVTASGTAQLIDVDTGQLVWEYSATGLLGRTPRVIVGPGRTLCLLVGAELRRLDPETGDVLWSVTLAHAPLARDDHVWLIDRYRFYCVTRTGALSARSLDDGRLLWQYLLTGAYGGSTSAYGRTAWRLARSGQYLVAYPARAQRPQTLVPLVVVVADSGKLVQRLALTATGAQLELALAGSVALLRSPTAVLLVARDDAWFQLAEE